MPANKNINTFKDVYFYYTYVNAPKLTLASKNKGKVFDKEKPWENSEWCVKAVFSEERYKKMRKKFPGCTNFKNVKEYTLEEFKEEYHTKADDSGKRVYDGNMPDFGEGVEDLVYIKFAQKCTDSTGVRKSVPKVFGSRKEKDKDGNVVRFADKKGLEVGQDIPIGNGSKGHIQTFLVDFGVENGLYLYPTAVCITDLREYTVTEPISEEDFDIVEIRVEDLGDISKDDDSDLDDDDGDDGDFYG